MKLGKISLIISTAALMALNVGAQVYNTGYSVSTNGTGQLVDNLWTVTALQQVPTGASLPTPPYPAFVLPPSQITWPWDVSAPPVGANPFATDWISNQQPAFSGSDTNGMITTYTLNFNAVLGGNYTIYFECDNYLSMYLGAVSPGNLFYTEPATAPGDFLGWQSTTVNIASGANQLNILVYNFPYPQGNYTGLKVNFATAVPEPSSMALAAGGFLALVGVLKRRKH